MLFNSPIFLLIFLPATLAIFYSLGRLRGPTAAVAFLTIASFAFYAYSSVFNFLLFFISIVANFILGYFIAQRTQATWPILIGGIVLNLSFIGYFKYAGLLISSQMICSLFHLSHRMFCYQLVFFLYISTNQLLSGSSKNRPPHKVIVTVRFVYQFFPQLIAGPIVHPRGSPTVKLSALANSIGKRSQLGHVLLLDCSKKLFLADEISEYSTPTFDSAFHGVAPSFIASWGAAFAYAFQIYFDFLGTQIWL